VKIANTFALALIVLCAHFTADAQRQFRGRVETIIKTPAQAETGGSCASLKPGKLNAAPAPAYPAEALAARAGGSVAVRVRLNEKGSFAEILDVTGNNLLHGAVAQAARRVKFSPTVCGDARVPVSVVVFYNFVPNEMPGAYFNASKIEDFADVKSDSQFYEAILNLAENYRIAYGFADKKFYADAPLTRGDFAEFLRRTLDLLAERARVSGKMPRSARLFAPLNSQNLKSIESLRDFDERAAYAESIKVLLLTYDVALTDETLAVGGIRTLSRRQVVEFWTGVFGADSVPINSRLSNTYEDDRLMTRGEFALFLQESLNVLTYKVLP
jgi:TonB family protein